MLALGLSLAACGGGARALGPGYTGDPSTPPAGGGGGATGGGGGSSGGSTAARLVGQWRRLVIIETVGDIISVTTTWTFTSAGRCNRETRSFSAIEGFPRTATEPCDYAVRGGTVAVEFDSGGQASYSFGFAGLSPTRLLLAGLEYQKL